MNNKELVILTGRNKFFGQTRKPWSSLDVDRIAQIFQSNGLSVEVYDFHEVINNNINLQDKTILYAFSQKENYRQYIRDIIYHLAKSNTIVPSYDLLKCHENKGYQEIFKKAIGLESLSASYFTSLEEIEKSALNYPFVLKTVKGSNGKGVYLIEDETSLEKVLKGLRNTFGIFTHVDLLRRKYFRKKKFAEYPNYSDRQDYYEYKEYLRQEQNFVIQEFVPDLSFDYRVLIGSDRYYVMTRAVKDGDFRASGSKLFSFDNQPNVSLLNYAKSIYRKFDSPFLSIDVLFDGKNYFLGEYQALHFGMSVIAKSNGYFQENTNNWEFRKEKPDLEQVFANTLLSYLNKTGTL